MNKKVDGNRRIIASQHVKVGQKNRKDQTYTDLSSRPGVSLVAEADG